MKTCPPGRGFILDENENCVCPPGYAFDENGNCVPCPSELGFIVDAQGRCVCDFSRGLILDPVNGRCICPPGQELNEDGICVDSKLIWIFQRNIVLQTPLKFHNILNAFPHLDKNLITLNICVKAGPVEYFFGSLCKHSSL